MRQMLYSGVKMNKKLKNVVLVGTAAAMASVVAACSSTPVETIVVETAAITETTAAAETSAVITQPAVTEQTAGNTDEYETLELDSDFQTYANTFITNFVEQWFPDYDRDTSSFEQIIDFAHIHMKLNSFDSIVYEDRGDLTFETFTTEQLQLITTKYFGMIIFDEQLTALPTPPESYGDQPAGPFYDDGRIWYEAADGEMYNRIGIVDSIVNPTDGTLMIDFSIYTIDMDRYWSLTMDEMRGYYTLTPEQAEADPLLTLTGSGMATVGVAQSGEYYLINYSVTN